jgi:AraC family transcriptional regulator
VEFDALLRGPSRRGLTSRGLGWSGFVVEHHSCEPGEYPESISDGYIVALWATPGIGEFKSKRGVYTRYMKSPGAITFVPPGIVPPVVADKQLGLVCCSLESSLVNGIEDSLDRRPSEQARYRTGFHDAALKQIMWLLVAEINQGAPLGRLYADHLIHAMMLRLLYVGQPGGQRIRSAASPLPTRALRRVIDRMETLASDLDLQTLADESGYSRRHFVRMFERATGCTPHRYLLKMRVERAQALLKGKSLSLIDVAVECGFSSQSHMSKVFRQLLGVTPGDYRRHPTY